MKVILLKDVARIGKRFAIVEVPNGHALNMLIPRGMALPATPENIKRAQARQDHTKAEHQAADATFADVAQRLKDQTITMTVEANAQGHFFKGVKADDIATALATQGYNVTASQVHLTAPLKEVGEYPLTLQHAKQQVVFTLILAAK